MIKPVSKDIVVVAMLIAFIGQAWAYTSMSCEMSADSHQSHMTMDHSSIKSHESMDHGDMKVNTSSSEDCCDVDCVCPANACTSTLALNSNVDSKDIQLSSESVVIIQSIQLNSISSSLYRPPIFA